MADLALFHDGGARAEDGAVEVLSGGEGVRECLDAGGVLENWIDGFS